MAYFLQSYILNSNSLVDSSGNKTAYLVSDIGINSELKVTETSTLTNYENITSVESIFKRYKSKSLRLDYVFMWDWIKSYVDGLTNGVSDLNDSEKTIYYSLNQGDDASAVGYYMGLGKTQAEAEVQRAIDWANMNNQKKSCYYYRAVNEPIMKLKIASYLDLINATALGLNLIDLLHRVNQMANIGIDNNNTAMGVIDFLNETNGYESTGIGSLGLQYKSGNDDKVLLVNNIKDILIYGKHLL